MKSTYFFRMLACVALMLPVLASAQNRPIRLIVPFPAGGSTDIIAREVAMPMGRLLNTTIVVDNRGGAGGAIGATEIARAAPDGLTLGLATQSTHAVNPAVYKNSPYHPLKDFSVIGELARAPGVLLISSSLPAKDIAGFIRHVRANPGKVTFSSPGTGSIGHIWGEQFRSAIGVAMLHVPYKGATPALTDLAAGVVDSTFTSVASGMPSIKGGRVRAIAISWHERLSVLPDVPTYAEAGLPGNNDPTWFGLVGPAGMPPAILRPLQQAVIAALKDDHLRQRYAQQGLFPATSTPEEFRNTMARDMEKIMKISREANISLD